jgi:hypothetical protein
MTPPRSENWFDRLAAPHTRRQGLKAAALGVAGAAAATLPFSGSIPEARAAEGPDACLAGCLYTARKKYGTDSNVCNGIYSVQDVVIKGGILGLAPSVMLVASLLNKKEYRNCLDTKRSDFYGRVDDCQQPFCPGVDKEEPGGVCDGCVYPYHCNPCESVVTGYICCVYPEGDCHGDCCPTHPPPGCP